MYARRINWSSVSTILQIELGGRVWRYQRGNQNLYIEEEQTTQWSKDTKGVIRICISKKNRQHNGQKEKYKRTRRVWRYQRGNQNPYIEEEQTTHWPTEKAQKDKQRSTKLTHKTKDRVTRTPLKTGGDLRCSGRIISSCSTSGIRRVNLDREVFTTSGTYPCSFVTQIFHNC
jgi:hypothetical protein